MKDPTQEEKNQAMENIECWKTQEHLKECRKCAPVGNWLQIEEEVEKGFIKWMSENTDYTDTPSYFEIMNWWLAFFKPYFQEKRHTEALEELEVVDNSKR